MAKSASTSAALQTSEKKEGKIVLYVQEGEGGGRRARLHVFFWGGGTLNLSGRSYPVAFSVVLVVCFPIGVVIPSCLTVAASCLTHSASAKSIKKIPLSLISRRATDVSFFVSDPPCFLELLLNYKYFHPFRYSFC